MFTSIYSLQHVTGAHIMLIYWLMCSIFYFVISLFNKSNRSVKGLKTLLIAFVISAVVIDVFWFSMYYDKGSYINHGIGAVFGLLMWIPLLSFASLCAALVNTVRNRKNNPVQKDNNT